MRKELETKQVLLALLRPAIEVVLERGIAVGELSKLLELGAFSLVRKRTRGLKEAANALGISARKAAQLAAKFRRSTLGGSTEASLARQLEFALWAQAMSRTKLARIFQEHPVAQVTEAIDVLLRSGRIVENDEGRTSVLEVSSSNARLVSSSWASRIDALETLADLLGRAVIARFYRDDDRAFARNIRFRVRPEDLGEIRGFYDTLREQIADLEKKAKEDPNAVEYGVSIVGVPATLSERVRESSE